MPPRIYPIRRAEILTHPLLGAMGLQRQLGLGPANIRDAPFLAWATGLNRKVLFDFDYEEVLDFVIDGDTGCLLHMLFNYREPLSVYAEQPNVPRDEAKHSTHMEFGTHRHTSMNLSPSRVLIATSDGAYGAVTLTALGDPDEFNQGPPSRIKELSTNTISTWDDPETQYEGWLSSAANPDPASNVFVVGGTEDTVTIKGNEDEWDMEVTAEQENPASSVDWLDNNVIMTGNWAGAVSLIDLRVKQRALRFQHPAGIVRIKKLGCNQIIVAGSSNAMMSYDIRFPPPQSFSQPSKAYMEFPDYQWYDDLTRVFGFDVYKNFIATSNSDGGMRMFNAATGKRVPFGGNGNGWVGIEKPIRTLKFAPDLWDKTRDDGYGLRIFACHGKTVEQWSFAENEISTDSLY